MSKYYTQEFLALSDTLTPEKFGKIFHRNANNLIAINREIIRYGISGSRLHGTHTKESDHDWFMVVQRPTTDFLRVTRPPDKSESMTDPDIQVHELGKFISLALKGNPTILESLFSQTAVNQSDTAHALFANRHLLLGADGIAAAYRGYANQQRKRNEGASDRGGKVVGTREQDVEKLSIKRCRHACRLILQAEELLTNGTFNPEMSEADKQFTLEFANHPDWDWYDDRAQKIDGLAQNSPLPKSGDLDFANGFLLWARLTDLHNSMSDIFPAMPLLHHYVDID